MGLFDDHEIALTLGASPPLTQGLGQRPRALVVGALAVVLVGCAAAAFGVAPMTPDVTTLPQRVVTESVTPLLLAPQLDALAAHPIELYRSEITRAGDTADSLLRRLGVNDTDAAAFLRRDPVARRLLDGRAGKSVRALVGEGGRLEELTARYPIDAADPIASLFTRLHVTRDGGKLAARVETAALTPQVRLGSGTITTSLFAATDESRIPDAIAGQMVEMFSTEVDFHRELRRGDTFTVVYEVMTADGEPITWGNASGRVLAAEFVNQGRAHSAVWFRGAGGKGGYFGLDGQSKRRTFLASPLEFSRVTSGFAMRMHPIAQTWRAHLGVDYSAPAGTPVRAVGDGTVEFAGWQNGYGHVVQIKHDGARATTYAHLSHIDVRPGQRVEQSQRIGAVGATGWATGPHLHFEFRVNGEHHDPLAIAKATEAVPLSPADKMRFAEIAGSVRAQLEAAEGLAPGGGRVE